MSSLAVPDETSPQGADGPPAHARTLPTNAGHPAPPSIIPLSPSEPSPFHTLQLLNYENGSAPPPVRKTSGQFVVWSHSEAQKDKRGLAQCQLDPFDIKTGRSVRKFEIPRTRKPANTAAKDSAANNSTQGETTNESSTNAQSASTSTSRPAVSTLNVGRAPAPSSVGGHPSHPRTSLPPSVALATVYPIDTAGLSAYLPTWDPSLAPEFHSRAPAQPVASSSAFPRVLDALSSLQRDLAGAPLASFPTLSALSDEHSESYLVHGGVSRQEIEKMTRFDDLRLLRPSQENVTDVNVTHGPQTIPPVVENAVRAQMHGAVTSGNGTKSLANVPSTSGAGATDSASAGEGPSTDVSSNGGRVRAQKSQTKAPRSTPYSDRNRKRRQDDPR
ncbi:uncharacterized protein BXZ73DRAFT_79847 [Epithele typhae]|uniref:uncharacterized protein n=1 Tax=Epithele typhae TaxID=378194 RepID=UPI0020088100|nr:uncharacterized protein BXZ73DRAFT_79847 [Epithele typhae]KAH9921705.1 hypothetical protein BXZ73DRAFT_79847 [Epithele typhae]